MWKSTLISIMFLISPFLVCDPAPDVKSYILTDNGKLIGQIKAQPDGSLKYSVRKAKIGIHRVSLAPCNIYWCDGTVTLEYIRPKEFKNEAFIIRVLPSTDEHDSQYVDILGAEGFRFLNPPPRRTK